MVLAFAAVIAAGAVAEVARARKPPRTRTGRWALGLAIAFVVSFPILGLLTEVPDLEQGWSEPAVPILFLTALGAIVLGAVAREPRRRGLLLIPLLIGASALIFALGAQTRRTTPDLRDSLDELQARGEVLCSGDTTVGTRGVLCSSPAPDPAAHHAPKTD